MERIDLKNKTVFVTGAAGFIGSNLVLKLLDIVSPVTIVGIDNLNDYYDVSIKNWRLDQIQASAAKHPGSAWTFVKGDIADRAAVDRVFAEWKPDVVVNLAAQAGVRYSITNPDAYIQSNLIGFYNILEACRHSPVAHLVYASSSSVYGTNKKVPYSTEDKVDNHQEEQRAHGPRLLQALQHSLHRSAVLHRLRSRRPAGHGLFRLYQ